MRHTWPLALVLLACGSPEERSVEQALRHGATHYHARAFAKADSTFGMAPEDSRAIFNRANALHRQGNWRGAIEQFRSAAARDSSARAGAATRYNLASTHLAEAMVADTLLRREREELANLRVDASDIVVKVDQFVTRDSLQRDVRRLDALIDSSLAAAMEGFKATLRRDPNDDAARFNLAYTQRLIALRPDPDANGNDGSEKDKDQKLSARAEQIMKRADELVEKYKFREALEVMQKGLKEDPTLKAKKDYMDKLDVVTKAAQAT